jgi:hypothetical protein
MATTPTSIGPIGARQINRNLYVGHSDLTSVQKAVTVAGATGGFFTVIIPFDYTGGDVVTAVTGGSTSIEIIDQRGYQMQTYTWSGTQYTPQFFQQANGFISQGKPSSLPPGSVALYYDPTGTAGVGTAHIDFTANSGMGMPSLNFIGHPSDGTAAKTFARFQISPIGGVPIAGIPQLELPSQLGLFNEDFNHYNLWTGEGYVTGGKGMTIWAKAAENAIDFQGQTIGGAYDQTIRLNYLGGAVRLGPTILVTANGAISGASSINAATIGSSGLILANQIEAQTCEVGNSPVRTFANTPDGPGQGMVWPTDGIAVSLGDHWQDPSIDPASLATWPAVGIPVSTGSAWGASLPVANLATWPAAGYAISTGTAWAASISPTLVPLRNQINTFTVPQNFTLGLGPIFGGVPAADYAGNGLYLGWDNNGTGAADFICQPGTGASGFNWWTATGAGVLSKLMGLDNVGNLTVPGSLNATTQVNVAATTTHLILDSVITAHPNSRFGSLNLASTSIRGGFQFDGYSSDFSQAATYLLMWQDVSGVHSSFPVGDVTVNGLFSALSGIKATWVNAQGGVNLGLPDSSGRVVIGQGGEGSPTIFMQRGGGTANQHNWSNVSWDGSLRFSARSDDMTTTDYVWCNVTRTGATVTGIALSASAVTVNLTGGSFTVSGGAKNFSVPDPLDESKIITHSCLEGPEVGVFYRGEVTTENGRGEVTLPDYFEGMTFTEDRSVMLTQIDDQEEFALLAASRITDGKFRVTSSTPTATVAWEVKAVRRIGVDRLVVRESIDDRPDLLRAAETPEEDYARRAAQNKRKGEKTK